MNATRHVIFSFLCLPCGNDHRFEIGLPLWVDGLHFQGTLEELSDQLPEVLECLEKEEMMRCPLHHFMREHAHHDVRYIITEVSNMKQLLDKRSQHFKKVVGTYENYRDVNDQLRRTLDRSRPQLTRVKRTRVFKG